MAYTKQGPFSTGGTCTAANLTAMDNGIAANDTGKVNADGTTTMSGAPLVSQTLGGVNKVYLDMIATDGKRYQILERASDKALILWNSTDALSVLELGPAGGTISAAGNTVWHAGNDGSGSGLDADTLDGHDSTYFAPAGNYVNKAGDTMTGALTGPAYHGPADSALAASYTVGTGFVISEGSNGLVMGRNSGDAAVRIANRGTGGVGFATGGMGGQKLAEAKSNGDFIIHGTTYWTDNPSAGFNNSGSYENFDVCEEYPTDRADYAPGAVLCPHGDVFARCEHDNCHAAAIVSAGGAFHIGGGHFEDSDDTTEVEHAPHLPLALAGRVLADTQDTSIAPRDLVCADGAGGVRKVRPGEGAFTIGYALTASDAPERGKVGVFVRPLWCIAPGA